MKVVLICFVISCPLLLTTKAAADFSLIHEGKTDKIIIFVHGLWGDPNTSFTTNSYSTSWPELIAKDNSKMRAGPPLSEYAVGTLGYPASSSDTLSITEIANRLVTDLYDSGVFDKYSQIFFICHSLGGIVIKEIFHDLKIEHSEDSEKVLAIFLISTPSQGAPAANFIKLLPRVISGRLVIDIQTIDNNTYLQSLESKWKAILRIRKNKFPLVYCAYETQTVGGFIVVSQIYTATTCDENPRPENSDHINIVKPKSVEDSIYKWVRGRIASIQRMPEKQPEPPIKKLPMPIPITVPSTTITVPSTTNAGVERPVPYSGDCTVQYVKGGYKLNAQDSNHWSTAIIIFKNLKDPEEKWIGNSPNTNSNHKVAIIGGTGSQEEAEKAARGIKTEVGRLKETDTLTFMAMDGKTSYRDNEGAVELELSCKPRHK